MRTDRLRFDVLTQDTMDPHEFYQYCSGERAAEMTRYMPWSPHEHPKESLDFLRTCAREFEECERATYAVYPRDGEDGAGEFAGIASLEFDWDRDRAHPGAWFLPRFWGREYSLERAGAFWHLAFEVLDFGLVAMASNAENQQCMNSQKKILDRFGGQFEGVLRNWLEYPDGSVADQNVLSVSREQWNETAPEIDVEHVFEPDEPLA